MYQQANESGWVDVLKNPQTTSAVVVALFTYLLWRVTKQQAKLLGKANTTADGALAISKEAYQVAVDGLEESRKANATADRSAKAAEGALIQTRRSVDVSIEAARGKLVLSDVLVDEGDFLLHYVLKNIGSGPLNAIQMIAEIRLIFPGSNPPRASFAQPTGMNTVFPIEAGGSITTHPTKGIGRRTVDAAIKIDPVMMPLLNAGALIAAVQVYLRYTTIFNQSFQARITFTKNFAANSFSIVNDPILTNEKRLIRFG